MVNRTVDMLGVYNHLADKPQSMCVRMFPERLNGGQKPTLNIGNSVSWVGV